MTFLPVKNIKNVISTDRGEGHRRKAIDNTAITAAAAHLTT